LRVHRNDEHNQLKSLSYPCQLEPLLGTYRVTPKGFFYSLNVQGNRPARLFGQVRLTAGLGLSAARVEPLELII
jgi:hypothetical protein